MKRRPGSTEGKGGIELLEETFHLLRATPRLLAAYYLGALPFVLGILYYVSDMARDATAAQRVGGEALALSLLFIWMKTWQAVYCSHLNARVQGRPAPRWDWHRIGRMTALQGWVQGTGLVVLPIAAVIVLPFGWVFAFYQNATVLGDGRHESFRAAWQDARRQATLWPRQNHLVLLILSGFGLFLFLNLVSAVLFLPQLMKTLFGWETELTMSLYSLFNTTYLAIACGLTYLCFDPIVKAVYLLRCFYGDSLQSGEDLKVELKRYRNAGAPVLAGTLLILMSCIAWTEPDRASTGLEASRAAGMRVGSPVPSWSADQLDRSLDDVLQKREYRWRMPRQENPSAAEEEDGWLAGALRAAGEYLVDWIKAFFRMIEKVVEWIMEQLFPQPGSNRASAFGGGNWVLAMKWLLFLLLIGLLAALGFIGWRLWLKRKAQPTDEVQAEPVEAKPDLTREEVTADQLPEQEWAAMAADLLNRGEYRLALRAWYLAGLAHLAERELVVLARFKSNRDYQRELNRRGHVLPAAVSAFEDNVSMFERVWYGVHEVSRDTLDQVRMNWERIRAC